MALKKTVATYFGTEVADAYHRVDCLQLVGKKEIEFRVRVSVDGIKPHFADAAFFCPFDINGSNPFAQAYAHLKTLPEFADAVDC